MSRDEFTGNILFHLLDTAHRQGHVGEFAEELLAQAAEAIANDRRNRREYDLFAEVIG